jgi:hypothetical protein
MALLRRTAPFAGHGFLQPIACPESHGNDCFTVACFIRRTGVNFPCEVGEVILGIFDGRKKGWQNGKPALLEPTSINFDSLRAW